MLAKISSERTASNSSIISHNKLQIWAFHAIFVLTFTSVSSVPPGRPCNVWLNNIPEDANALPLSTLWRSEIARGHGAAQKSTWTMRWWWWGKGKVNHDPQENVGGCSSPSSRPWAHRWRTTNVCDAWPVRCQNYGSFPATRHHHRLVPNYTAWWQRHTCVNSLTVGRLGFEPAVYTK